MVVNSLLQWTNIALFLSDICHLPIIFKNSLYILRPSRWFVCSHGTWFIGSNRQLIFSQHESIKGKSKGLSQAQYIS
jgi:hypothetical protein